MAKAKMNLDELENLEEVTASADELNETEQEETFDFAGTDTADGIYHGRVKTFVKALSKNGKPQYVIDIWVAEVSRTFKVYLSHAPAAQWKIAETLRALGVAPTGPDSSMAKFKLSDMPGRLCRVQIKNEDFVDNSEGPSDEEPRKIPKIVKVMAPSDRTVEVFADLDGTSE